MTCCDAVQGSSLPQSQVPPRSSPGCPYLEAHMPVNCCWVSSDAGYRSSKGMHACVLASAALLLLPLIARAAICRAHVLMSLGPQQHCDILSTCQQHLLSGA